MSGEMNDDQAKNRPPVTAELSVEDEETILGSYVEAPSTQEQEPGCVDGRAPDEGEGPYMQALGGSMNVAVLKWVLQEPDQPFPQSVAASLTTLSEKGFKLGVHDAENLHGATCGCGFCEKLGVVIDRLRTQRDEVFARLTTAVPALAENAHEWAAIMRSLDRVAVDTIPAGKAIVDSVVDDHGGKKQVLQGEHEELAAVVNTQLGQTLDVRGLVAKGKQAFNLDLASVLQEAEALELDANASKLLTLGLYVATEMVLVEDKGKPALPILIR